MRILSIDLGVILMKKQNTLKTSLIAAVVATGLISGAAIALTPTELSDTNGDGVISAEEITAAREASKVAALAQYDTDGDGELSRDERRAAKDARKQASVEAYDADGDGELSRDERQVARDARQAETQAMLDVNGDGEVSEAESAGFDEVASERGNRKGGKRGGGKGKKNDSE